MACNPDFVQYVIDHIGDVEDRDYLTALIKATIPALPKPKAKKSPLK